MFFYEILIDRGPDFPTIERHIPAAGDSAARMAKRLGEIYNAKSVTVRPITDPVILARLIARIATLSLLLVMQLSLALGASDHDMQRAPRPPRTASRSISRRKDDA